MNILSLFDGMACGMIAMRELGWNVERYVAFEVDKYAIKTATHNFPEIEERGDVFDADFTEFQGFDWLIGGSPCTYWSIAQTKNRETEASGIGWELFSQYVRALHEAKPRYFLYENNKSMAKAIRASISETFGFEPIEINSALVSAQNRKRLYWVGIRQEDGSYRKADIEQPEDRKIYLQDILETGAAWREKAYCLRATNGGHASDSGVVREIRTPGKFPVNGCAETVSWLDKAYCLDASYYKGTNIKHTLQKHVRTMVAEPVRIGTIEHTADPKHDSKQYRVYSPDAKSVTLCGQGGGLGAKTGLYAVPMRVQEATKQGYVDILPGECVDLSMKNSKTRRGRKMANKANCLTTSSAMYEYCGTVDKPIYHLKNVEIEIDGERYPIKLKDGYYIIRMLTVRECMRLQTVPEWYDWPVSDSQAYKMLGNGWTVEVIKHLLREVKA